MQEQLLKLISIRQRRLMAEELASCLDLIPDHVNLLTVSDWAERKRILPAELTPIPGPFRWDNSPYMREIADCLSESSPVQKVAVMKGGQITFTVSVLENWIGYIIDSAPGPTMFVSGDKEVAQTSVELRLDRMIESTGLQEKIFSQVEKKHNKKTGDTKSKKEFPGGFLLAIGPNSGAKLRMISIKNLMFDEVDAYPVQVGASDAAKRGARVNEGDPIALAETRTAAFSSRRKILYGSTPTVEGQSKIKELFKMGDQRYYHVPCKHCGYMQPLKWENLKFERDEQGRLVFDLDEQGQPIAGSGHVWYECDVCKGKWKDSDKATFLLNGEWRATAEAEEPNFRSYHISSLYSPVGMLPWEKVVLKWLSAQGDPTKLREFMNTVLGECWEERGEAPQFGRILEHREDYHAELWDAKELKVIPCKLPDSARPLLLTIGADVQLDRIEAEVVAWGREAESWSIAYLTLPGNTDDTNSPAWRALYQEIVAPHAGRYIDMALIDSGYNSPVVYQFCSNPSFRKIFPVKGDSNFQDRNDKRILALREVPGYHIKRVDVNTDHLKLQVYNYLNRGTALGQVPTEPLPGYCHFPIDYDKRYADGLTAEQRVTVPTPDGKGKRVWKQHGRNEPLDCRCYALACLYVMYYMRRDGYDRWNIDHKIPNPPPYTWASFWAEVEKRRAEKPLA